MDPTESWIFYSQSMIKRLFDAHTVKSYTLFISKLFILTALFFIAIDFDLYWLKIIVFIVAGVLLLIPIAKYYTFKKKECKDVEDLQQGYTKSLSGWVICNQCGFRQKNGKYCENCFLPFDHR